MIRYNKLVILNLILLSIFLTGCPENPIDPDSIEAHNDNGWKHFSNDRFADAIDEFEGAIDQDFYDPEANVGKGWSILMLDGSDVTTCSPYLNNGLGNSKWENRALCGLSIIQYIENKYPAVITDVDRVLGSEPTFLFNKYTSIDWHDLVLLKAKSQFYLKQYDDCFTSIQALTLDYDFNSVVDSSWVIDDVYYPSFPAVLSEAIVRLSEIYD